MRMRLPPHHRRDNQTKHHRHRNRPAHDKLLLAIIIPTALTRQQIKTFALARLVGFETEHDFVLPRAAPRDKPRACGRENFHYRFTRATRRSPRRHHPQSLCDERPCQNRRCSRGGNFRERIFGVRRNWKVRAENKFPRARKIAWLEFWQTRSHRKWLVACENGFISLA